MITPEYIIGEVACITGIPVAAIIGRRRNFRVLQARYLTFAALRKVFDWWSLSDLSAQVGKLDHGTAIHALARHAELLAGQKDYQEFFAQITSAISQGEAYGN